MHASRRRAWSADRSLASIKVKTGAERMRASTGEENPCAEEGREKQPYAGFRRHDEMILPGPKARASKKAALYKEEALAQSSTRASQERFLLHSSIVFLVVNLAGQSILLMVELCAVSRRQFSVVRRAHVVFFRVQRGFLGFQISGLSGGQLAALDTVGDAVLLVILALVDGRRIVIRDGLLCECCWHYRRGQNRAL